MNKGEQPLSPPPKSIRIQVALWATLTVCLLWLSWGVLPVAVLETDAGMIAHGAFRAAEDGAAALQFAYNYDMQSGVYALLIAGKKLWGVDPFVSFSLLSAAATAAFILIAGRWIGRLAEVSWPGSCLLLLSFQEVWTSAYYPNTSILAAPLLFLGFDLLTGTNRCGWLVLGGMMLGAAACMRFDVVVLAPVVLLLPESSNWRARIEHTILIGLAAVATLFVLAWFAGADPLIVFGRFFQHAEKIRSWPLWARCYVAFFSLLVMYLTALGAWEAARGWRWRLLAIAALGAAPIHILLLGSLSTPKYFLYTAPFVALLMARGVVFLRRSQSSTRMVLSGIAGLLFLAQYVVGIQVNYGDELHPRPFPTLARIGRLPLHSRAAESATLVFGAGATISTHDSIRLSSGIVFGNIMWRRSKEQASRVADAVASYLEESEDDSIALYAGLRTDTPQFAQRILYNLGYALPEWSEPGGGLIWSKGNRKVRIWRDMADFRDAPIEFHDEPIVAIRLWNDPVEPDVQRQFSGARPLAEGELHSAEVLRPIQ